MNISRRIVDATKVKLSSCKNIEEYTSSYREAYDDICNLVSENSEMTIPAANMVLQGALLLNMGAEYAGIASTIELE